MLCFYKDKVLYNNDVSPSCEDYKEYEVTNKLCYYLRHKVKIKNPFTFEDLFNIVEKNKDLINVVFYSSLIGVDISVFIDEMRKKVEKQEKNEVKDGMEFLEVCWYVDQFKWHKKNEITIEPDFHGWGEWKDDIHNNNEDKEQRRGGFSVEFSSANELKNYELKINKTFTIFDEDLDNEIIKGEKEFSLFEFLDAIFYEITFFGEPENRDREKKELMESYKEVEEAIKTGDHSKFKSFNSVQELIEDLDKK